MNFSLSPENVSAWREGHVMNDIVFNLGCCCPGQGTEEVFSYIEVVYQNGNRHYFYENEAGFKRFETDFYDKRFTSFHEFWTTEEAAEENVICSLSATMYAAKKMPIHILPLLRWMN